MVGSKHKLCWNFMVACEASGAREHGHDSRNEASSGRTNDARKGVVLEESRGGEEHQATQAGRPRPAGLPY
jgi:hypothetical protein